MDQGISPRPQRFTIFTASDSFIRRSIRITTFPMIRKRSSSAETLTPVVIHPSEAGLLEADFGSRTLLTQLVPFRNVQRGHDNSRYEMDSAFALAIAGGPRARVHEMGKY